VINIKKLTFTNEDDKEELESKIKNSNSKHVFKEDDISDKLDIQANDNLDNHGNSEKIRLNDNYDNKSENKHKQDKIEIIA